MYLYVFICIYMYLYVFMAWRFQIFVEGVYYSMIFWVDDPQIVETTNQFAVSRVLAMMGASGYGPASKSTSNRMKTLVYHYMLVGPNPKLVGYFGLVQWLIALLDDGMILWFHSKMFTSWRLAPKIGNVNEFTPYVSALICFIKLQPHSLTSPWWSMFFFTLKVVSPLGFSQIPRTDITSYPTTTP